MKANQKFLNDDDRAVSPVIAVILMVAITVVLAATVYVWVSGFSQSGSQAKSLSVTQTACSTSSAAGTKFTVVSVNTNFLPSHLQIRDANSGVTIYTSASTTALSAGDTLTSTAAPASCSDTLNFVDTGANAIVATITLH